MPVATDPRLPGRRLLLSASGAVLARFEFRVRDDRLWADRLLLEPGADPAAAADAVMADLAGWSVSTEGPLAARLLAAGGRAGRHSRIMSRDLRTDPAPAAWLAEAPPAGVRLTRVDRSAGDLAAACFEAFPPEHPDHAHIPFPERPELELEEILSGRLLGPLLGCSGLAIAPDGSVAGAILINASEGEVPFGGPWIAQLFRRPGARGAGRALLRRALALATRDGLPALGLAVTHGNSAMGLYSAHGFVDVLDAVNVDL